MKSIKKEAPEFLKYFFTMGLKQKEIVRKWYCSLDLNNIHSISQQEFLDIVKNALVFCNTYRIATIEPYVIESNEPVDEVRIGFKENQKPCCDYNLDIKIDCIPWIKTRHHLNFDECYKASYNFARKYKSDLATIEELFLWYAYRIAMGYWTLEYICDDSSSNGNYEDSPFASHNYDLTSQKTVGGFNDGIGNIYKVVKGYEKGDYCVVGGMYICSGKKYPVARYDIYTKSKELMGYPFYAQVVPVVVLRK